MIDQIKEVLSHSGADAWEITDTLSHGWEFYFIRHRLDQNRAKVVEHFLVTVYTKSEDGKFLGSASSEIYPTSSQAEIEKTVQDLKYRASLVKNPYYTLNQGDGTLKEDRHEVDVQAISEDFIEALSSVPETQTEDINSYEIFVSRTERHYVNSCGVDTICVYPDSAVEVVVNARDGKLLHGKKHEIELYRMYQSGTCDKQALVSQISRTLQYGHDKLITQPTPALKKGAVLFSGADMLEFYEYYKTQLSANAVYMKLSDAQPGKPFCKDARGDQVTMKAVSFLPNSTANYRYDREGALIKDRDLLDNGIVKNLWGSRQYACYLGLEDTSIVENIVVSGGTKSEKELRSGTYLEVVEFSDFQVDPMSGDIAGEIRLGYYHDGDSVTIVSGGSISGSFRQAMKEMYLSAEQTQYNTALVPSVMRLENLTITGIETKA